MSSIAINSSQNKRPMDIDINTKSSAKRRFHYPHEHGAWWTFGSCLLAGLGITLMGGSKPLMALSLAIPMAVLFLISDWVSGLSGAFLDVKIRVALKAWQPWLLASLGVASGIIFALHLPAEQRTLWASAIVVQSVLVILLFLLRQELPPRDLRLLLISSLMLTAPVLFMSALAHGWTSSLTWEIWAWPALFYPAGVLYVKGWMSGNMSQGLRLTWAALPYLLLAALSGLTAHWSAVVLFTAIALRTVIRIRQRLAESGGRFPAIKEIRRFGWEQVLISILFTAWWLTTFLH